MNKFVIFFLGAAAGSFITCKILEEKYKRIADEEINSVIERFREKEDEKESEVHSEPKEYKRRMTQDEYLKLTNELGYDYKKEDNVIVSEEEDGSIYVEPGRDYIDPYVIPPEEFGELETYDTKSWTYYADNVITDDMGEIVYDPEPIIGDALEHFGEFEDDSVHVRNENTECDYEIIKCEKSFSELNGRTLNDLSTRN